MKKSPFIWEANTEHSSTVYPSGESNIDFYGGKEQLLLLYFYKTYEILDTPAFLSRQGSNTNPVHCGIIILTVSQTQLS